MGRDYRDSKKAKRITPKLRDRTVSVDGHSERWLKRGFPWVYPKELTGRGKGIKPGTVVQIVNGQGQSLGTGIFDDGWIAVRRFRNTNGPVDKSLLQERIQRAQALRDSLIEAETDAYRVVNGENDGLPGIRIDRYGAHFRISLDSPCLMPLLDPLCDALETCFDARGVYLAWRPDPRDKFTLDQAPRPAGLLRGHGHKGPLRVTE